MLILPFADMEETGMDQRTGRSGCGDEMLTCQVDRVVVDKRVTLSLVEPSEREHTL
jgi:hypothetical protein